MAILVENTAGRVRAHITPCLVRYTIPAARKATLTRDLASLGVSHETLFHSVESLAKTIREEICEEDYKL